MNYKKTVPLVVFVLVFFAHLLYFKIFVIQSNPAWWTFYKLIKQYFISFSLGLAFAYDVFAFIRMRSRSKDVVARSVINVFLV